MAMDISAIGEIAEDFDHEDPKEIFKWCQTDHQLVDHLSKAQGDSPEKRREILIKGVLSVPQENERGVANENKNRGVQLCIPFCSNNST